MTNPRYSPREGAAYSEPSVEDWEIQGFMADYGDGHPAWSVGFTSYAEMVAYLLTDLEDTACEAVLIRRGPQVEVDGIPGPWRLVPTCGSGGPACSHHSGAAS